MKGDNQGQGGEFEGCAHGFSVFFCLSSVVCLSWWDETKGANQGQGGGLFVEWFHGFLYSYVYLPSIVFVLG